MIYEQCSCIYIRVHIFNTQCRKLSVRTFNGNICNYLWVVRKVEKYLISEAAISISSNSLLHEVGLGHKTRF